MMTTVRPSKGRQHCEATRGLARRMAVVRRIRGFYAFGIGLLLLGTMLVIDSAGSHSATASPDKSVYGKLRELATTGDKEAQEYLARVDAYLRSKGQSGPPQEANIAEAGMVGQTKVRVKGRAPFGVKLYNEPEFKSTSDIAAYANTRKAALKRLAQEQPDREIEVSISPSEYVDFATMWKLKEGHGLTVEGVTVSFFRKGSGEYDATMYIGEQDSRKKSSSDLNQSAGDVEAQVRALIPPTRPGGTRVTPSEEVEAKVTWVRGKMRADKAVQLDADPAVLLVDPITDLVDPHKGRAMEVQMVDVPHLLTKKKELEGNLSLR